jgi:hypothetical protein
VVEVAGVEEERNAVLAPICVDALGLALLHDPQPKRVL